MPDNVSQELPHAIPPPANNVTVIGAFNAAILQPNWISRKVFGSEATYSVLLAGGAPVLQSRDGISWSVQPDRLVVAAEDISRAANFVIAVLDTLRHTPVQAAGLNFQRGATLSTGGAWFRRLSDLNNGAAILRGAPIAPPILLRANRDERTSVGLTIQPIALPMVMLDFNFNRNAPLVPEEELRVNDLIDHIRLATDFEREAAEIAAEVSSA